MTGRSIRRGSRSRSELERATDIAASTPGVRQAVSHVLLIDDPRRKAH
jgi:hypothetical protein